MSSPWTRRGGSPSTRPLRLATMVRSSITTIQLILFLRTLTSSNISISRAMPPSWRLDHFVIYHLHPSSGPLATSLPLPPFHSTALCHRPHSVPLCPLTTPPSMPASRRRLRMPTSTMISLHHMSREHFIYHISLHRGIDSTVSIIVQIYHVTPVLLRRRAIQCAAR